MADRWTNEDHEPREFVGWPTRCDLCGYRTCDSLDDYCEGCNAHICSSCDQNSNLSRRRGSHEPGAHEVKPTELCDACGEEEAVLTTPISSLCASCACEGLGLCAQCGRALDMCRCDPSLDPDFDSI